jgi:hypothetical protein
MVIVAVMRRPCPRSSWWRERLSRLLSTLSARRRASMGVLGITVGPESTLDRRCRSSDSLPTPLVFGKRWIRAVGGWHSSLPALRALARDRALCLLCRRSFEQRLQLLAHPSLLGGGRLWAAVQHHGRSGKVLRRPPEKWWSVNVDVGVDVRALVGTSVVVGLWPACRWRRCAAVRLVCSWAALASVSIPLAGLPLHRNVLRRLSIARLGIHAELLA